MARTRVVIDLSEEGERDYNGELEEIRRIIDLTQDDDNDNDKHTHKAQQQQQFRGNRRGNTQRNAPLDSTYRSVPAYRVNGVRFRIHDFVELNQPVGERKAQFVEVKQILVNAYSGEVLLCGLPYIRTARMGGLFERSVNEVCQILEIDDDDNRPDNEQAMIQVHPRDVLTIRQLHKTNTDYHSARNCRFGNDPSWLRLGRSDAAKRQREEFAPLTCRWRMRFEYHNYRFRRVIKAFGTAIFHLTDSDVDDPYYRVSDEERRGEWLKGHPRSAGQAVAPEQYLMCDAFCGAGGASSGARMAGLEPMVAIEMWKPACESYNRNFPRAKLFWQSITDFIANTKLDDLPYCHVLHISPPCQYYSGAKVNEGKDDEANEVALFVCGDLIKKFRPRIVTMEQTFGLMASRFTQHFNKLIQGFTAHGYSVQWRERVELIQYGLPQNRKRLIIVGAAPGEKLPPWPAPTHGNGRTPWVTEAQAIGRLPRNVTLHDVRSARQVDDVARNPNIPLMRTITCSGAQGMMHYSGQRDYTLREFATLQGFPLTHQFVGPSRTVIKKQIGNAFPASVAKVFFQGIRVHLEREDRGRRVNARAPAAPPPPPPPPPRPSRSFGFSASSFNDRRRQLLQSAGGAPQSTAQAPQQRQPGYSRLNGDLDEDEALQAAMRESRRERSRRRIPREVITIYDSDEDGLPGNMTRLSVEPSHPATSSSSSKVPSSTTVARPSQLQQHTRWPLVDLVNPCSPALAVAIQPPSPPTTGGSSSSQQTTTSSWSQSSDGQWSVFSTPFGRHPARRTPLSAASSVTLADSPPPPPSPCQQQSRKRKANGDDDDDDEMESARKRTRDAVVGGDDAVMGSERYYAEKLAEREQARAAAREAGMGGTTIAITSSSSSGTVAERLAASGRRPPARQASVMSAGSGSCQENGRPLAFGKRLGKLPVARDSSKMWDF